MVVLAVVEHPSASSLKVTVYVPASREEIVLVVEDVVRVEDVNPFGPVHSYEYVDVPPEAVIEIAPVVPFLQVSLVTVVNATSGPVVKPTLNDCVVEQPVEFVTTTVKVPFNNPDIFWEVDVNPFGPVHANVKPEPPLIEDNVIEPVELEQSAFLTVALLIAGAEFIVTRTLVVSEHPFSFVTLT